jgi:hypothetical protein
MVWPIPYIKWRACYSFGGFIDNPLGSSGGDPAQGENHPYLHLTLIKPTGFLSSSFCILYPNRSYFCVMRVAMDLEMSSFIVHH